MFGAGYSGIRLCSLCYGVFHFGKHGRLKGVLLNNPMR